MNTLQKIFTVGYIAAIIFGLSGLVSLATGFDYSLIMLAIGVTGVVILGAIGLTFLGAWIYGWLEKFSKEKPK